MKKIVAYIVAMAVALFCAAVILSPAVAGAEELHETTAEQQKEV